MYVTKKAALQAMRWELAERLAEELYLVEQRIQEEDS